MHHNALRFLRLINNLLDFTKIEAGRMNLRRQETEIASLLQTCVSMIRSTADSRQIQVNLSRPREDFSASIDPDLLEKAVFNLLSNALKFTHEGGKIDLYLEKEPGNQAFTITVQDNGIGIPKNKQAEIFERFSQVDSSATRKYEGTGIGLALTREIARLHGGEVSVESEMGKGSVFTIRLPLEVSSALRQAQHIAPLIDQKNALEKTGRDAIRPDSNESSSSEGLVSDSNGDLRTIDSEGLRPSLQFNDSSADGIGNIHAKNIAPNKAETERPLGYQNEHRADDQISLEAEHAAKPDDTIIAEKMKSVDSLENTINDQPQFSRKAQANADSLDKRSGDTVHSRNRNALRKDAADSLGERSRTNQNPVVDGPKGVTLPNALDPVTGVIETLEGSDHHQTILVVEDTSDMRDFLVSILEKKYRVISAHNGKQVLELAVTHQPDLILSDVMMPEMDGYEMAEKIRQVKELESVPIIMLTARAGVEMTLSGFATGANDYIVKPFDSRELLARVKSQLELKAMRDKLQRHNRKLYAKLQEKLSGENVDSRIGEDDRATPRSDPESISDTRGTREEAVPSRMVMEMEMEMAKEATLKKPRGLSEFAQKQVMTVMEFIRENFEEQLNRDEMAASIGMHPDHLSRVFKQFAGCSIVEYINQSRIAEAVIQLKTTEKDIITIAYDVGFESLRTFNRVFQKIEGQTPSEVRSEH